MHNVLVFFATAAFLSLTAGGAIAGDNNQLYVLQESPVGSLAGNSLSIDQSDALDSLVRGLNSNLLPVGSEAAAALNGVSLDPQYASQRGENNRATLTVTGTGGELQLLQADNALGIVGPAGAADGNNVATLVAATNALGGVAQVGNNNTAGLELEANAQGLVVQLGSRLTTDVLVGQGGIASIIQNGSDSDTGPIVVAPNSTVTYTQNGAGLAPLGTGVQVLSTSNPGTVTITQTAW